MQVTPLVGEGGIYDDFEISSEIDDAVPIKGATNVPICLTMSRVRDSFFLCPFYFVFTACVHFFFVLRTACSVGMSVSTSLVVAWVCLSVSVSVCLCLCWACTGVGDVSDVIFYLFFCDDGTLPSYDMIIVSYPVGCA